MIVANYLVKVYPDPPCWNLVADVYLSELGQGVTDYRTINNSIRSIAAAFRLALHKSPAGFSQVTQPQDFAVVLMAKSPTLGIHHCGIYYGGKVLHALPTGVVYESMTTLADTYPLVEVWSKA